MANLGRNLSGAVDLSTLKADLNLSPTDSSSSLNLGMLQARGQRPATEAQLPGTGQQQAQQSSGTKQDGDQRAIQRQAPVRATMSCIISNCNYVTTPGYNHIQQLALHVPTCPIAVPKDNGGHGTQGRHQELTVSPPTPHCPRIPSLFDLNTYNPTQTRQKHGSE